MLNIIQSLSRTISFIALVFSGFGLVAMTAIIFWQVVARYGLNASPAWAEQAALVLLIWFIFFAGAAGVREGFHIRIVALVNAVSDPVRKTLNIFANALVAGFGLALAYWGGMLVIETWYHDIPTLPIPRGLAYIPAPISGAFMAFFAFEHIILEILDRKVSKQWN